MKKKSFIATISTFVTVIACAFVAVMFFMNNMEVYGASIGSLNISSGVNGSVSATYNRVDRDSGETKKTDDMTTIDGSKVVTFGSSKATSVGLLNPSEGNIALTSSDDLVVTYFFEAVDTYYASFIVADEGSLSRNIQISYSIDGKTFDVCGMNNLQIVEVKAGETTIVSIKVHIINTASDANMNGAINWDLTTDSSAYLAQQA